MTTPTERAAEVIAKTFPGWDNYDDDLRDDVNAECMKSGRTIAEALAAAGLIATETEWGVAFPCRPGCPAGDEHISSEDFGAGEEMARALIADDSDRLTLKTRHVTPWKDADA